MKAHPFIIELLQIVITLCVTLLQVTAKQNEEKKKVSRTIKIPGKKIH